MKVTISGYLHDLGEVQTFDSGFRKQVAVICPNPGTDYPDYFPVEMLKDNVGAMDSVKAGGEVTVDCFLGGREYQGRYYLGLKFYKLTAAERSEGVQAAPAPVQPAAPASDDKDLLF